MKVPAPQPRSSSDTLTAGIFDFLTFPGRNDKEETKNAISETEIKR